MKQLVLTDFDGTLTVKDTFIDFARHAVGMPRLLLAGLQCSPWLAAWKLGLIQGGSAKQRLFSRMFKGMPYESFLNLCESYAPKIAQIECPSTLRAIEALKNEGAQVAIVSASIADWIRPWAATKGIDTVLSTELELDTERRLTGRFATPNCYGAEKVRRARQHFGPLTDYVITAFGDTPGGDGAMLAAAARPVWVK